jgi:hypothetical protein
LRGEACDDLDGAFLDSEDFESGDFCSAGEGGACCATASAARNDSDKIERKILFMLDLIRLELFLVKPCALPET